MLELFEIPGRGLAWYDPADPALPAGAKRIDGAAAAKAVKPKNKAVKPATK